MKKTFLALAASAIVALTGCSKWDGDPITQNFSIDGAYTELEIQSAFDVTVSNTVDQVVITAGENIMPKVIVEVTDNTLKLRLKRLTVAHNDIKVLLPYNPNLKSVDLSGASEFRSAFPIVANEVDIEISGASDFYGDIEASEVDMNISGASSINGAVVVATELDIELSGASKATLEGQVGILDMNLSGSSDIKEKIVGNRYALACGSCEGSISGSSDAYIHCDGTIRVSVSGASDLHYTGNANTTGSSTSGSSNIVHEVL